jgi:hypothetical protein
MGQIQLMNGASGLGPARAVGGGMEEGNSVVAPAASLGPSAEWNIEGAWL